jgi:dipeptidyl aminopeptidase/acylaminoacyl peptidase
MKTQIFGIILLSVLSAASLPAQTAPILIEEFVKHPRFSRVEISPNGEFLALTVDRGEQDVLTVLRTRDLSLVKVNQLPEKKSIGQFGWVSDSRLIFNAVIKQGGYAQPFNTGEWFAVNADGSMPRPVIFYGTRDATQATKSIDYSQRFSLLDSLQDDPVNVLMTMTYPLGDGFGAEVVVVDTLSGKWKTQARAPAKNCGFSLNAKNVVNYALCSTSKDDAGKFDSFSELYRYDGKAWALVSSSKKDGFDLRVIGESKDGRLYAMRDDRKAPAELGYLDATSGTFNSLFKDEKAEISGYILAADRDSILGVMTEAGAPEITMLDSTHRDGVLYDSLSRSFEGQLVRFESFTRDGDTIVFSVVSDRNPGELYLYDRKSNKARFLLARSALKAKQMSEVMPFSFTSRDGMEIHGYLTIPNGSDGKNLPLIVNPHGGPMGPRDNWDFNWEAQLFASRGYAVLQVNFRGSGGYGKAFQDMAYGQWADGIQNDIIDAVQWTIAKGHADPERICIYGGSFGGYSALMAPVKAPGLFKCAFGYVGAYSAEVQMTLSDTSKREDGLRYLRRALGDTERIRNSVMPITYADKVKIPVFMAAGARDPRCPPENTTLMAKALEAAGNKPEGVIIQSGEMHGFYDEKNRLNLYTQMLAFFARHIGEK